MMKQYCNHFEIILNESNDERRMFLQFILWVFLGDRRRPHVTRERCLDIELCSLSDKFDKRTQMRFVSSPCL